MAIKLTWLVEFLDKRSGSPSGVFYRGFHRPDRKLGEATAVFGALVPRVDSTAGRGGERDAREPVVG